jgi:hypothetical protein
MKIELICVICKGTLDNFEITQDTWDKFKCGCMQVESPFCKKCANKYMYTNGTMKEELATVSMSNHESQLG